MCFFFPNFLRGIVDEDRTKLSFRINSSTVSDQIEMMTEEKERRKTKGSEDWTLESVEGRTILDRRLWKRGANQTDAPNAPKREAGPVVHLVDPVKTPRDIDLSSRTDTKARARRRRRP